MCKKYNVNVSFKTFNDSSCEPLKAETSHHSRRASEKTKKRMKMADLKAFVETKLLSKSEKALEKIGQDEPNPLHEQVFQIKFQCF